MRRFWLVFAQTATICLAVLFVVSTLRPDLVAWTTRGDVVTVKEPAPEAAAQSVASYSDAARKAMPAVVNIFTSQQIKRPRHPLMDDPLFRYFFGDQPDSATQRREGLGSGVIVSEQGYILTNHHVVESVDQIEVALSDSRKVPAKVVGTDPETDLAVLKIEVQKLPAITFARAEQLRVGDVVLAIGNPFGVGQTVTFGIVSGLGRSHLGIATFENFIQTDAAIHPGNSGGALVDVKGNLVGVNTAIYSQTGASMGIGYAIPVSIARQVMEQIIETGAVTRGWFGVDVADISSDLAESLGLKGTRGAIVGAIERGSPAEKAGLRLGDIITTINGRTVPDTSMALNAIAGVAPGKLVPVKVLRRNQDIGLQVMVGKRRPRPRAEE